MTVATPIVYPDPGFLCLTCPACSGGGIDGETPERACRSCGGSGGLPMPLNPSPACMKHGLFPSVTLRIEGLPCPYCYLERDSIDSLYIRERCSLIEASGSLDYSIHAGEVDECFVLSVPKKLNDGSWPTYKAKPFPTTNVLFPEIHALPYADWLAESRVVKLHIRPNSWGIGGVGNQTPPEYGVALSWVETP